MMTLKDLLEVAGLPTAGGNGSELEVIVCDGPVMHRWAVGAVAVEKHGDKEYLVIDISHRRSDLEAR